MVRVGVIPTISPYLLPPVTPALHAAYPRLTIVWIEDKTPVLTAALSEGALDAALLALEAEVGDFEHAVIAKRSVRPGHVAGSIPSQGGRGRRGPRSSQGQSVLLLDDGHCFRDQALAVCANAKARELEVRATSLPTLSQMVARGLGVTLLPRLAVATEAERAGLAIRPFAEPAPRRTIALIWRRGSPWAATFRRSLRRSPRPIRARARSAPEKRRGGPGGRPVEARKSPATRRRWSRCVPSPARPRAPCDTAGPRAGCRGRRRCGSCASRRSPRRWPC